MNPGACQSSWARRRIVSLIGTVPNAMVVHPSVPVKTMQEFIAYAKANPGKINFGSSGGGSPPHLSMELLRSLAGINLVHVPYKGAGPALADVIAGQIPATFTSMATAAPLAARNASSDVSPP